MLPLNLLSSGYGVTPGWWCLAAIQGHCTVHSHRPDSRHYWSVSLGFRYLPWLGGCPSCLATLFNKPIYCHLHNQWRVSLPLQPSQSLGFLPLVTVLTPGYFQRHRCDNESTVRVNLTQQNLRKAVFGLCLRVTRYLVLGSWSLAGWAVADGTTRE